MQSYEANKRVKKSGNPHSICEIQKEWKKRRRMYRSTVNMARASETIVISSMDLNQMQADHYKKIPRTSLTNLKLKKKNNKYRFRYQSNIWTAVNFRRDVNFFFLKYLTWFVLLANYYRTIRNNCAAFFFLSRILPAIRSLLCRYFMNGLTLNRKLGRI